MVKLFAALRILVAFVLGALVGILGTLGTGYFYYGSAAADSFITASPGVDAMKRRLHDVEAQRNAMTRNLEEQAMLMEQLEKRFEELGRRLSSIESAAMESTARARGSRSASSPTSRRSDDVEP